MEHSIKPISTESEREENHQVFLRAADRMIEKYKSSESLSENSPISSLEETSTQ